MKNISLHAWGRDSYLGATSDEYLESLYSIFVKNPDKLPKEWQQYFSQLTEGESGCSFSHADICAKIKQWQPRVGLSVVHSKDVVCAKKEAKVAELIHNYRIYGHHMADLDPLGLTKRPEVTVLQLHHYGLTDADLSTHFQASSMLGLDNATLEQIIHVLTNTYCRHIGVEYMHITNHEEVVWLQQYMESCHNQPQYTDEQKQRILDKLITAEGLEQYLGNRYVGQKRFSLEGGETLIPIMDVLTQQGGKLGVKEAIIGMSHRGRLNVLVNVIGKSAQQLLDEFEGKIIIDNDSIGDVKYHLGFSSNIETEGGIVHLSVAFNPSHLEVVGPVVQGSVRARQRRRTDQTRTQVLPIVIHGDAAIAAQGVVMETFNFSQLRGYNTGGAVHIVINNQIGFTTSNPLDARSTLYCTDIAKVVQAPILHVNGNDPEAAMFVAKLAIDYRMRFHKDIVIDLVCYRRHGHNEADEPMATQPLMYRKIHQLPTTLSYYGQQLIDEKIISEDELQQKKDDYFDLLDSGGSPIKTLTTPPDDLYFFNWQPYLDNPDLTASAKTSVSVDKLKAIAKKLSHIPQGFMLQAQVNKMMLTRQKMFQGQLPLNWGAAEALAYASLLVEGYPVRISGQDSGRGTFAHRHAILRDQDSGAEYVPLANLGDKQASFIVIDSPLSELSVLAFEYGFATADPESLTIWEAQFGDFGNMAQVVVDQFISSGGAKWDRLCGVVLFLPHGYEGMGSEHSSARLERYLQLCAQQNMSVCVPSTPAQIFHLLRLQMIRKARKPLIVLTPKSLLRNKAAVSSLDELAHGEFHYILPEKEAMDNDKVSKVILCSGKVYYELAEQRSHLNANNVAILRVEQLYPFPEKQLKQLLAQYPHVEHVVWCQEEPFNQGAWLQIRHLLENCMPANDCKLHCVARPEMAAPCGGSAKLHVKNQKALIEEAFSK